MHWFAQVNRQETIVKKKIIMSPLYLQFLKKSLQFADFFTARCLDIRLWDLLYFICWSSIHSIVIFRSSQQEVFFGKGVLKICSKFTGGHTCWSGISIKFLCKFIKITLWHGHSPVNLQHIFGISFPNNTSGRPVLYLLLRREETCQFSSYF